MSAMTKTVARTLRLVKRRGERAGRGPYSAGLVAIFGRVLLFILRREGG